MKWKCVILLLTIAVFTSCQKRTKPDRAHQTGSQLKELGGAFNMADFEIRIAKTSDVTTGTNYTTNELLTHIVRRKGVDYFRCTIDREKWLCTSPEAARYGESNDPNAIAVYCPVPYRDSSFQPDTYVALNFAGEIVSITDLPSWKPFPVWELAKRK